MKINKFFIGTMLTLACTMAFTACDPDKGNDPFKPAGDTLTVAQVISQQDGKEALVKGYVVGYYNVKPNPGECVFSADAPADTTVNKANVLIADNASETNPANVVCVQLPAGQVRNLVNLGENPGNLGKVVVLKGVLTAYNTLPGVKTTSYAEINGKKSTDPVTELLCYRIKAGSVDEATFAALKVGDNVVLRTKLINWFGNTPETNNATLLSINGTAPAGTITVAAAVEICNGLAPSNTTTKVESEEVVVAGEVSQITEPYTDKHKNITFKLK